MTSFIAACGSGRSTSAIPAVPAAWSVTTIAFIRKPPVSVLAWPFTLALPLYRSAVFADQAAGTCLRPIRGGDIDDVITRALRKPCCMRVFPVTAASTPPGTSALIAECPVRGSRRVGLHFGDAHGRRRRAAVGHRVPPGGRTASDLQLDDDLVRLAVDGHPRCLPHLAAVEVRGDGVAWLEREAVDVVSRRHVGADVVRLLLLALIGPEVGVLDLVRIPAGPSALVPVELVGGCSCHTGQEPDRRPHPLRLVWHLRLDLDVPRLVGWQLELPAGG